MSDLCGAIVTENELERVKKYRSKTYVNISIHPNDKGRYESDGWEVEKNNKKTIKMQKIKSFDEIFEDEVWMVFAGMGFSSMNCDRNCRIQYDSKSSKLTHQIDVLAIDDEAIILIECKASKTLTKKVSFKETIDAIGGRMKGLISQTKKSFPNRKIKFIFTTKNYVVSEADLERMKKYGIEYFDEEAIGYYKELTTHLGTSARYQMLGALFSGQKILGMDTIVPAIRGNMGGLTYYSFSVEPEKLLKIGYVLHRNDANKNLMPTYQRLIKKSRLSSVKKFIETGGYFPNSLVVNIDTAGRNLQFDISSLQNSESTSKIGLLHLPQKYRSAYIIDGQHRLYAYTGTKYATNNTVPVIAFVDMDREKQLKLFMEINENQKSVSKNLRNTLNADLLWSSEDYNLQRHALRLHIAQRLGEEKNSALFGKVVIGENEKSNICCITIDTIQEALRASNFFNQYRRNTEIIKNGTFDRGANKSTEKAFFPFLRTCFEYFEEYLSELWNDGDNNNGILTTNNGIWALIKVINDIVDHLINQSKINPKADGTDTLFQAMKYYLDPVITFFQDINFEQKIELRKSYGSGGKVKVWHTLQKAINDIREDFIPDGMIQYFEDNAKMYNEETFKLIRDIELHLKGDFKAELNQKYGDDWFREGLPKSVYDSAKKLAADKEYEMRTPIDPWDCLNIINYKEIATYGSHWLDIFEKKYTRPEEAKISGGKDAKTNWLQRLNTIRNQNFHTYSVTKDEYEFVKNIYDWLFSRSLVATS